MVIFFNKQFKANYKRFNLHYKKSIVSFHKDYFGMYKQSAKSINYNQ